MPTLRQIELLFQQGQLQAAEAACRELLTHNSKLAPAWALLGAIALQSHNVTAAADAFRTAVDLNPRDAFSWYHLSITLQLGGRPQEAEQCSRTALLLDGANPAFWLQFGSVLFSQERFEEAAAAHKKSLSIDPFNPTAWNNYGASLHVQKLWPEALSAYETSLGLQPNQRETRMKLADVLERMYSFPAAERVARKLADEFPDKSDVWLLLGRIQLALGKQDDAVAALRRATAIHDTASSHSRLLQALQYQQGVEPGNLLEEHRCWARSHADGQLPPAPKVTSSEPIGLGFVSSDLGLNPVAHMVLPILEALDNRSCSVTCYFDSRVEDALTPRFRNVSAQWRHIFGLSHEMVAAQVRDDDIDILIDLMGHAGNRLPVFAKKAAPVQITWFGYVGTTGMQAMDYLLADRFHVRPGEENHYQEAVLRMPHGYACYQGPDYAPAVCDLPAIKEGSVTFGCFNNPAKWTAQILDAWGEILHRVPTARLLLKYYGLHDPETQNRFHGEFDLRGINAERITMEGWSPHQELLRAYQRVDIGLDTQPYSGGVTTCEALWMGVPVITFLGKTFAGRHATSHLMNAGYPQFVAEDRDAYIELAVEWANRLPELAPIRTQMREQMRRSPLCDAPRFASELMRLLREAYDERCVRQSSG